MISKAGTTGTSLSRRYGRGHSLGALDRRGDALLAEHAERRRAGMSVERDQPVTREQHPAAARQLGRAGPSVSAAACGRTRAGGRDRGRRVPVARGTTVADEGPAPSDRGDDQRGRAESEESPAAHPPTVAVRQRRTADDARDLPAERPVGMSGCAGASSHAGLEDRPPGRAGPARRGRSARPAPAHRPAGPHGGRRRARERHRARTVLVLAAGRDAGPPLRRRGGRPRRGHPDGRAAPAHRHRARHPGPRPRALPGDPAVQRVLRLRPLQRADPLPGWIFSAAPPPLPVGAACRWSC